MPSVKYPQRTTGGRSLPSVKHTVPKAFQLTHMNFYAVLINEARFIPWAAYCLSQVLSRVRSPSIRVTDVYAPSSPVSLLIEMQPQR